MPAANMRPANTRPMRLKSLLLRPAPVLVALALAAPPSVLGAQTDPPAAAESPDEGFSLMEEGAKLLFRGLMQEMEPALDEMGRTLEEFRPLIEEWGPQLREVARLMGDIENYNPPEILPNGDILIRRKTPLVPAPLEKPAPGAEIEL